MRHRSLPVLALVGVALLLGGCFGKSADESLHAAQAALEQGKGKEAVILLKNALQDDPQLLEARYLLGRTLLDTGDAVGAEVELEKAERGGYDADKVVPALAESMLRQRKFEPLIARFRETQLKSPSAQAELATKLATAAYVRGKTEQGDQWLRQALAADPQSEPALLLQIRQALSQRQPESALQLARSLAQAKPRSAEGWKLLGDVILYNGGSRDEARAAYEKAIAIDPRRSSAYGGLLALDLGLNDVEAAEKHLAAMRKAVPDSADALFFSGWVDLQRGRVKEASETVETLLKAAPEDGKVLHLAGAVAFGQQNHSLAETHLSKALNLAVDQAAVRLLLAQTHLRLQEPAKALSVLAPLLAANTPPAPAMAIAGEAYLQQGEGERAKEMFTKAAQANPNDERSRLALALGKLAGGDEKAGLAALRELAQQEKGDNASVALIQYWMRKREHAAALSAIDALEHKRPGSAQPPFLRGLVQQMQQQGPAAQQSFATALQRDPSHFPAVAQLVNEEARQNNLPGARKRLSDFIAANPKMMPPRFAMLGVMEQSGDSPEKLRQYLGQVIRDVPDAAAPRAALARMQLEAGDAKAALTTATEGLAAIPNDLMLLEVLSAAQFRVGDVEQGQTTFNKLVAMMPGNPQPLVQMAEYQMRQKDLSGAAQSLKRALAAKSDHLPAQQAQIALWLQEKNLPEARKTARTVQSQRPKEPIGYLMEGDVEVAAKNHDAALVAYRRALPLDVTSASALRVHRTMLISGKRAEADAFAAGWLKEHSNDLGLPTYLAEMALANSDWAQAESRYKALLTRQPDNGLWMNNLAWVMLKLQRPEALAMAEKANAVSPNQAAVLDTLAEAYQAAGKLDKAIEVQSKAVALKPDADLLRLKLAKYLVAAGRKADAKRELTHLAQLGDKFPQQQTVKDMLAAL